MTLGRLKLINNKLGLSVVEIIVAIGIFIMVAPTIIAMILGSHSATMRSEQRLEAAAFAQEGLEAARSIRDHDWGNLTVGDHGLTNTNGYWEFSGISETGLGSADFERVITVQDLNAYTKNVTVTLTWDITSSVPANFSMSTRLTNWSILAFIETLLADFDAGEHNSVNTTDNAGGEIELDLVNSWASASVFLTEDLGGNGNITDIFIKNNQFFVTATDDGAGSEFLLYDISDIDDLNFTFVNSLDILSTVHDVVVFEDYAYLATASNAQEVIVVRLSDFSIVNTIDILGVAEALSIEAANDELFVGTQDNGLGDEFYVYDISDPEALLLNQLDTLSVDEDVNDLAISGNYVYLATNDNVKELIVYKISTGSEVNSLDLAVDTDGLALFASLNELYFGTAQNGGGTEEFFYIDIINPEVALNIVNSAEINEDVNDIYIEGQLAFLATDDAGNNEVKIIDLSDFSLEADIDLNGAATSQAIAVKGKYIYAGSNDNTDTIQVVNTAVPSAWQSPSLIDSDDIDENFDANDVYLDGQYAYVVTDDNGGANDAEFYIYDISNPANVNLVGTFDVNDFVHGVHVLGDYAYLATDGDNSELVILDISNKINPLLEGTFDIAGTENAWTVFASGTNVFVGTQPAANEEFFKIDVTNPAAPALLASYEIGNDVNDIIVSDDSAYLATDEDSQELLILNIAGPAIYEEDSYDLASDPNANGLHLDGNTAYVVTDNDGGTDDFYIFDVENNNVPQDDWSTPVFVGSYDSDEGIDANDVHIDGNYAYMVTENNNGVFDPEFYIIDISVPGSPVLSGSLDVATSVNDVHVSGNYAYLATDDNSSELIVVDISNKAFPIEVGTYNSDEGSDAYSVYAVGNTVYLGTDNNTGGGDHEFYVLDASNPLAVSLLGSYDVTNDVNDIIVSGDYAYLASDDNTWEFLILDISNPAAISEADRFNMASNPNAEGLDIVGNTAYVVTNNDGGTDDFYIFDITDPTNISLTGSVNLNSTNNNVSVNGNYAFIATNTNAQSLKIIDISNPAAPVQIGSYNGATDFNGVFFDGVNVYTASESDDNELTVLGANVVVPDFISLIGSTNLDSNNFGVAIGNDYAYVATDANGAEMTVVDISNLAAPLEFGQFDAEDQASAVQFDSTYVYLSTFDNDKEFQVIGESALGALYSLWGAFTSQAFDSGSATASYNNISWTDSGLETVKFQIRTADTEPNLANAIWVGSDGTNETYYDFSGTAIVLDPGNSGTRWLQYRAILESFDGMFTPSLEDVTIEYNL